MHSHYQKKTQIGEKTVTKKITGGHFPLHHCLLLHHLIYFNTGCFSQFLSQHTVTQENQLLLRSRLYGIVCDSPADFRQRLFQTYKSIWFSVVHSMV